MFLCRECKHLTNRSALSHATLYAMVLLKSKLIFLTLLVLYLNFPGKVLDHLNFRLIINRSSHVSFKAVPLYLNRDTFQLLKDFALQTALSKITISINYIKERIVIEVRSTRVHLERLKVVVHSLLIIIILLDGTGILVSLAYIMTCERLRANEDRI